MDQREARKYTTANPPVDLTERRPSLLGRLLFRRTSSTSDETIVAGMQPRRGSVEAEPGSITQRVQTEMTYNTTRRGSTAKEASIFT
ncbi:unnamed protein product [Orchesella dallaii]|uniref:Uncharacterized protein n=1 Tax=Orchesella dallaii TaxID=48710 RepID=A0ABP1Q7N0_9HEXA